MVFKPAQMRSARIKKKNKQTNNQTIKQTRATSALNSYADIVLQIHQGHLYEEK